MLEKFDDDDFFILLSPNILVFMIQVTLLTPSIASFDPTVESQAPDSLVVTPLLYIFHFKQASSTSIPHQ